MPGRAPWRAHVHAHVGMRMAIRAAGRAGPTAREHLRCTEVMPEVRTLPSVQVDQTPASRRQGCALGIIMAGVDADVDQATLALHHWTGFKFSIHS